MSRIRSGAKPVFSDPLVADGSHVCGVIGSAPGGDESDDGGGDGQPYDDPHSIHGGPFDGRWPDIGRRA